MTIERKEKEDTSVPSICSDLWKSSVQNRAKGRKCPYCSGKFAITGENDLQTMSPELMVEWDYEKKQINPVHLKPSSSKKVWWKCLKGHNWKTRVTHRTHGSDCPYCNK